MNIQTSEKLIELQTSIKDTKDRMMELLNLALTPLVSAEELNKLCHQRLHEEKKPHKILVASE